MRRKFLAILISFVVFAGYVSAQVDNPESNSPNELAPAETVAAGQVTTIGGVSNEPAPKPIVEFAPGAKKYEGMITLYQKKDKLYAEITGGNLNTDYLIAFAIAKGSGNAAIGGYTLGEGEDWLWQFKKVNDRIQIVRRNIRFKADSGTPEEKSVGIGYTDSILYSLPIVAKGENGGDIIDLDPIFMTDLPRVGSMAGASFVSNRSSWGEIKGFNNNVEIQVDATFTAGGNRSHAPDGSSFGVTIHYSISRLVSSGYSPRLADDRIGYFTTAHKNFSRNHKDANVIRYINRWNVQKADPSVPLSPPKKPIVIWIEKTVPFKYRPAVQEGILEWNKAFEKIGIANAIEVRQQSDNDSWDPEDINYNTFRWITAEAGFAMGPSHVNPLTGEILDSDIIMDAGFIDSWQRDFDIIIAEKMPALMNGMSKTEQTRAMLDAAYEHQNEQDHEHDDLDSIKQCTCKNAREMSSQIALAALALAFQDEDMKSEEPKKEEEKEAETSEEEGKDEPKEDEEKKEEPKKLSKEELKKAAKEVFERMVFDGIKATVMHEVGHTLGLRHNFKASSWLTIDEINDPNRSKEFGFTGSIMDYVPVNIAPKGQPQGDFFMKTIGPYDHLAIEYGYKVLSGGTEGEKKDLQKIAQRQSEKGMHYSTDEDVIYNGPDPLVNRFDLGTNPIDFARTRAALYQQLLPTLVERAVEEGDNYRDVGTYYRVILSNMVVANDFLARNVGGYYINRDHRGDPQGRPPIQIVDANIQRESVAYLCEELFTNDNLKIPAELYNQFGTEKWIDWSGNRFNSETVLRNTILSAQTRVLLTLLNTSTLSRLDDSELRVNEGEDVYTIVELFDTLTLAIFRELNSLKEGDFSARNPAISLTRRNLQEYYYTILAEYALGNTGRFSTIPESCCSIPRQQLVSISSNIQAVLSGNAKLDPASKAHLLNLNERIQKTLNASIERVSP